jgi:ABC-type transport system substrate-binding protein
MRGIKALSQPGVLNIVAAIASQLAKINININVEPNLMPKANFFGYIRVPIPRSSFITSSWDVPEGDAGSMYSVMFYSRDKQPVYGVVNRGGYFGPKVDAPIDEAGSTASLEKRDGFLQQATSAVDSGSEQPFTAAGLPLQCAARSPGPPTRSRRFPR